MWGKKSKKQLEVENQNLQNREQEEYGILKQKTIKELIAPSRNRCF